MQTYFDASVLMAKAPVSDTFFYYKNFGDMLLLATLQYIYMQMIFGQKIPKPVIVSQVVLSTKNKSWANADVFRCVGSDG